MGNPLITLSARDWLFFFNEQLATMPFFPKVWDPTRGNGFGENISSLLWIRTYQDVTTWILFHVFKFNWLAIELTIFIGAFLVIGTLSVAYLLRIVFEKPSKLTIFFSSLLYLANTYILMLVDGGQLGIVLAYATAPFVVGAFIRLFRSLEKKELIVRLRSSCIAGLALSLAVLFDPRIAFVSMGIVALYIVWHLFFSQKNPFTFIKNVSFIGILSILVALGIHAFWLIPFLLFPSNPLVQPDGTIPSVGSVKFFSFADFSHAFSLLHPNWPENIFGKTYFLYPEFLFLPLLAFASLLFVDRIKKKDSGRFVLFLFFVFLGLIGTFLAKGAKDPFGSVYFFAFDRIPGFNMFRDPTKWYGWIALSYAVLIPFTLSEFAHFVKRRISLGQYVIYGGFILLFVILLRPVFFGKLSGEFRLHTVPKEYIELKNVLLSDQSFSRTLWLPQRERYGFYSFTHPAVTGFELFKGASTAAVLQIMEKGEYKGKKLAPWFEELGVGRVIIPIDSEGEFFVEDRRFSKKVRDNFVSSIDKISWLKKNQNFYDLSVYDLESPQPFAIIKGKDTAYRAASVRFGETTFSVSVADASSNYTLILSERYDPNWVALIDGSAIRASRVDDYHSGFEISKKGSYTITIVYALQRYANAALFFSVLVLLGNIVFLMMTRKRI